MRKKLLFGRLLGMAMLFALISTLAAQAQDKDAAMLRAIYSEGLANGEAYQKLDYLCNNIGGRLAGSPQAAAAVEYTKQVMEAYGFDTVYLQPVMVPHWVRGAKEKARVVNSRMGTVALNCTALGNSVGSGPGGVFAEVIEVQSIDELNTLGEEKVSGKIVFFNRAFDPTQIETFRAYGGAVRQRGGGASAAAKLGAIGAVVRSMASNNDDIPHTGSLRYQQNVPKIPAIAISTNDANQLSGLLKDSPTPVTLYFETHCKMLPDVLSYNVVGELRGTEKPEEIIVVGGHLDSWDTGDGAHDDGAGCVQSIEVLRIFQALDYAPKHTIRAVMFMNEENGLRGGVKYAELAQENGEKHVAAMESDRGGFTPRGFSFNAGDDGDKIVKRVHKKWAPLFEPYLIYQFVKGGGGADISPLRNQNVPTIGFAPDSQRYFNYHHTPEDTFDKVDPRELHMGACTMAALLYLIDQHGL